MSGHEWRATFEVKVLLPSRENIANKCRIEFYWKRNTPEEKWIDSTGFFKYALASIDGHWLDRQPISMPLWQIKTVVIFILLCLNLRNVLDNLTKIKMDAKVNLVLIKDHANLI